MLGCSWITAMTSASSDQHLVGSPLRAVSKVLKLLNRMVLTIRSAGTTITASADQRQPRVRECPPG